MKRKILFLIVSLFLLPKVVTAAGHPAFSDNNLYQCVVDSYNAEQGTSLSYNTQLTDEQLSTILLLNCDHIDADAQDKVVRTEGIEKLANLEKLYLSGNRITSIDLSHNPKLRTVRIEGNLLTHINLGSITNVTYLALNNNQLIEIDLSHLSNLGLLDLNYNKLTRINVEHNPKLVSLGVRENEIRTLDISGNTKLSDLEVDDSVKVQLTKVALNLQIRGNFITKIQPHTTIANFQGSILSNNPSYEHKFIQENIMHEMNAVDPSTNVKTGNGYHVQYLEKGRIRYSETYTLVVAGDITGTGDVNIADVARLYQYYKGKVDMSEVYILAGDVTNDGQIQVNDISKIYQYTKKKINSLE